MEDSLTRSSAAEVTQSLSLYLNGTGEPVWVTPACDNKGNTILVVAASREGRPGIPRFYGKLRVRQTVAITTGGFPY